MLLPVLRRAGRAYIAGPELQDAVGVARRLAGNGFGTTIAYWDAIDAPRNEIVDAYSALSRVLAAESMDCYLSVKAPSIQYDSDLFARLLQASGKDHTRLHFDSLGPETADPTFALVSALLAKYPNVTCTLPGRWARSLDDADWAVRGKVGVRVVKGQWVDLVHPHLDPQAGYLRVIERLAGRARYVAVATHNPVLAKAALRRLVDSGTPCELELLFGLPVEPALKVARAMGIQARLYVPYGYGWLPYSLSQAKKNPRILWWMLKDMMLHNSRSAIYAT
jgi:proline dehydrogenase